MSEQKTCTKCGCTFEATPEFFARDPGKRDGLRSSCKLCTKAYYAANRDRLNDASKKWKAENSERYREYQRAYFAKSENREKKNKAKATYYLANRERILARMAAYYAARKAKQEVHA